MGTAKLTNHVDIVGVPKEEGKGVREEGRGGGKGRENI